MSMGLTVDQVVSLVREGHSRFMHIHAAATKLLQVDALDQRVVDRLLQQARRAGKVTYTSGDGWKVA